MRARIFVGAIASAAAVLGCAAGPAMPASVTAATARPRPPLEWRRLDSGPGRYSVEMPGVASQLVVEEQTEYGVVLHHKAFAQNQDHGVTVAVVYFDLPAPLVALSSITNEPEVELDAGCDAQLNVWKGEIRERRYAMLAGRPARECVFDLREPFARALVRVLRDGGRMYQLMAVWPRGRDPADMPARFFGSFRLEHAPREAPPEPEPET